LGGSEGSKRGARSCCSKPSFPPFAHPSTTETLRSRTAFLVTRQDSSWDAKILVAGNVRETMTTARLAATKREAIEHAACCRGSGNRMVAGGDALADRSCSRLSPPERRAQQSCRDSRHEDFQTDRISGRIPCAGCRGTTPCCIAFRGWELRARSICRHITPGYRPIAAVAASCLRYQNLRATTRIDR